MPLDRSSSVWVSSRGLRSDDQLKQLFSTCGAIESVKIMNDRDTGRPRFAYVNFRDASSVRAALTKLHGVTLEGHPVTVRQSMDRTVLDQRPHHPGGGPPSGAPEPWARRNSGGAAPDRPHERWRPRGSRSASRSRSRSRSRSPGRWRGSGGANGGGGGSSGSGGAVPGASGSHSRRSASPPRSHYSPRSRTPRSRSRSRSWSPPPRGGRARSRSRSHERRAARRREEGGSGGGWRGERERGGSPRGGRKRGGGGCSERERERDNGWCDRGGSGRGCGAAAPWGDHYRGGAHSGFDRRGSGRAVVVRFRLALSNLATTTTWQEIKDFLRHAGDPTYALAPGDGTAVGEFSTLDECRDALERLQGVTLDGMPVTLAPLNFDERTGRRTDNGGDAPADGRPRAAENGATGSGGGGGSGDGALSPGNLERETGRWVAVA